MQNGVAIDPGDSRATRIVGLITGQTNAVANGTKVGDLAFITDCAIDGEFFKKYRAIFQ